MSRVPCHLSSTVLVKLRDDHCPTQPDEAALAERFAALDRLTAQVLRRGPRRDASRAASSAEAGYPVEVRSAFDQPAVCISRLMERAATSCPAYAQRAPNLHTWARVELPDAATALRLVTVARRHPAVELAWVAPVPAPPPTEAVWDARDYSLDQSWLRDAPAGLGAAGLSATGAGGAGVRFADIEEGWWVDGAGGLQHPDLGSVPTTVANNSDDSRSHGTHILGIVMARRQDPQTGVVGLAPDVAGVHLFGTWRNGKLNIASALVDAAAALAFGDVLLVETQVWEADVASPHLLPAEADTLIRQTIQALVAAGIVVVAAAGNGGADLDTIGGAGVVGAHPFKNGANGFDDSGAILVAAAMRAGDLWYRKAPPYDVDTKSNSNYGGRIDCFALGSGLYTTSVKSSITGVLTPTVGESSDTSGAAAIIAGAALAVQGMARAATGAPLSPLQVRQLLRTYGTPGAPGIGIMPDLRSIQARIAGTPDVLLRDTLEDVGAAHPGTGRSFLSPDLTLSDGTLVARPSNRGPGPASHVTVALWWAEASTLTLAPDWHPLGVVSAETLAAGSVAVPLAGIPWGPPEDAPEHVSFIATVSCTEDPALPLACFDTLAGFEHALQMHNNLAMLCHGALSLRAGAEGARPQGSARCAVQGAPDRDATFRLDLRHTLPAGSQVRLTLPNALVAAVALSGVTMPGGALTVLVPSAGGDWWTIGTGLFRKGLAEGLLLELDVPVESSTSGPWELALRQLHDGLEVGRYTWRITA